LGEHSGRYGTSFADFYTSAGFALVIPDLPGHGKTEGPRGHIADNILFLDHIDHFLKKTRELYPDKPVFIYGHSMGGSLALWYSLARNPQINGMVVTSPGIHTHDPVPPLKKVLAKVMNAVLPAFQMENGLDVNRLSHDKKVVDAYVADPLVHKLISARLGMLFISQGDWILEHAPENKTEILLMVGSEEGIVDKASVDQFAHTAPHVEYKVWPGLVHEIHNEPVKQEVYEYTLKWLKKQL
jgi:alpha-beta hydrolase superfamily lysophospholipase